MLIVIALLTALSFGCFAYSFGGKGMLTHLPSLGWASLITLPYLLHWPYFHMDLHRDGMAIVSAVLLAADSTSYLIMRHKPVTPDTLDGRLMDMMAWACTVFLIGIGVYHLAVVPEIPFLNKILGYGTDATVDAQRNVFLRDLPVPFFIRYVINFNVYIFGALALTLHWLRGRKGLSLFLAMLILAYSVLSTAKFPVVIAIIILLALGVMHASIRWMRVFCVLFFAALAGVCLFSYLTQPKIEAAYHAQAFAGSGANDPRHNNLPGDFQHPPATGRPATQSAATYWSRYLVYRIFLTPVEVAEHWYEYYTYVQKQPETLSSLLTRSNSGAHHPAVKVGYWTYYEKFPDKFGPDAHAYGAMDADAFAYGGMTGVVIAAGLLALIRILFAVFYTANPIARTTDMTSQLLMMIVPASGSVLALLTAHGLIVLLFIQASVWFVSKRVIAPRNEKYAAMP